MHGFAQWLGTTPLSEAIQSRTWLIAWLQAIHILVIGVVFVSMLVIALRVLGRAWRDQPLDFVWRRFSPFLWWGLAAMAFTGFFLIVGEPVRQANAFSFWLKMILVVLAVCGVLLLRRRPTRGLAWTMIVIWLAIIFLGRAIAYDVEVWQSWHLGT